MKKINSYLILIVSLLFISSCNDEWKDEQYKNLVSFKAPIGDKGSTQIYIRYKKNGKVTYRLPVIVSGSNMNDQDIDVHIAVDPDTLNTLNLQRFGNRKDLYYRQLDQKYYNFPEIVNIPAGSCTNLLDIDFSLGDLDMVDKWVLPMTIMDNPSYNYQSNMRKHYRKALLQIVPFNDYSGSYSATAMKTFFCKENGETDGDAIVSNRRTAYVVNEKTIFFYAGLMDEDLIQRALYKIYVTFNEDKSLTISSAGDINLKIPEDASPVYSINESMDATLPYLKHRYVTLRLEYTFDDITSAPVPIHYKVMGTLTLERNINTQVPDEDQAIEW